MSLKQLALKKWQIDYRLPNGKRRRVTINGTKKLAETILAKRKVQIAEDKYLDINKKEKIRFQDFAQEYLSLYARPNKKSWKTDEYYLLSLNHFFKGKYLYTIGIKDIERFKSIRSQEVSPATVNRELACLKCLFNRAVDWGKLKESPAKKVKFLKEPKGRLRFLEQEEIIKLLSNCSKHLKPIVILALNTGMRRGEILKLKWRDVNFRQNIITLLDTKNGEKREIHMNEQVKTALIRTRKHPQSPYIFCNKEDKPYYDIRKSFFTALGKSGIKDFHFHDLRHCFCSHLAMSGVDINTIRELAGHKDIRMTLRYSHLSKTYKQRAVDMLGKKMDTFWTLTQNGTTEQKRPITQSFDNKKLTHFGA